MSDIYIDALLAAEANEESVRMLLERGAHLGLGYMHRNVQEGIGFIPAEQAIHIVAQDLRWVLKNPEDFSAMAHLEIKALSTYASVMLSEYDKRFLVSLRPAAAYWMSSTDDDMIDLDAYRDLLIDWCQDFSIIDIKILDRYE